VVYRLADAANPPEMKFVNASGIPSNFVYGPLEPWFDQTWRPSEIELVK